MVDMSHSVPNNWTEWHEKSHENVLDGFFDIEQPLTLSYIKVNWNHCSAFDLKHPWGVYKLLFRVRPQCKMSRCFHAFRMALVRYAPINSGSAPCSFPPQYCVVLVRQEFGTVTHSRASVQLFSLKLGVILININSRLGSWGIITG